MTMAVSAQSVTVADIEAMPGQTAKATLVLTCPENTFSGLNFSIQFPATGFSVDKDKALADWVGAKAVGEMKDGKVKFSIASADNFAARTEVNVYFTLGNIGLDVYDLAVTNLQFDSKGTLTSAADVPFKVNAVDYVTLFETATKAPDPMENVKVLVKRNFAKDTWSTICLPFAMTEAQTKTAFGDGVVIGDYAGYEAKTEGKQVVGVTVKFTQKTSIEANHPYVIKPSKAVDGGFIVVGVNINPAKEDDLVVAAVERSKKDWSEMIGTFIAGTSVSKDALFLNGGKFWYSKGKNTMLAYRAYFDFYDVLTEVENASSRINISFDDVTAIKSVKTNEDEGIYTLSGQRVNKAGKGIYIVNGKKVIKK